LPYGQGAETIIRRQDLVDIEDGAAFAVAGQKLLTFAHPDPAVRGAKSLSSSPFRSASPEGDPNAARLDLVGDRLCPTITYGSDGTLLAVAR